MEGSSIAELINSWRKHAEDRVSSPLLPSFLISWCIWNYKFVLIVLSLEPVERKFRLFKEHSFPDLTTVVGAGMLLPLLTALLYIYAYPTPARWVFSFHRKSQQALNKERMRIDEETPLTPEAARRLRSQFAEDAESFRKEIERRDREIEGLRDQLKSGSSLEKLVADSTRKEKAPAEVNRLQFDVLEALESGPKPVDVVHHILNQYGSVSLEHGIESLLASKRIDRIGRNLSDAILSLTPEGKRTILRMRGELAS